MTDLSQDIFLLYILLSQLHLLICVHIMGVVESARKPRPHPFHRHFYQPLQEDTGAFPSQMVHVMSQACPRKALWGSPFSRTCPKHPHSRMSRRMDLTQLWHSLTCRQHRQEEKSSFIFSIKTNSMLWLLCQDPRTVHRWHWCSWPIKTKYFLKQLTEGLIQGWLEKHSEVTEERSKTYKKDKSENAIQGIYEHLEEIKASAAEIVETVWNSF